ncbi:hypothetical protein EVAR_44490_1 [Eumeta japonica]|uniref:Uncharacterized protein n=1 Tax=Eumeta variegata TaxID=151549 RepID=A0A4C1WN16_EUMVA|nr:hypothetical protein EVAR_44490_1 [Eumeta japonica]
MIVLGLRVSMGGDDRLLLWLVSAAIGAGRGPAPPPRPRRPEPPRVIFHRETIAAERGRARPSRALIAVSGPAGVDKQARSAAALSARVASHGRAIPARTPRHVYLRGRAVAGPRLAPAPLRCSSA